MALSPAHRRFLIVDELVGSTIVNFVVNGALAWLLFRSATSVPLFGRSSIASDTLATAFILPLLTSLIVTPLVRIQVARGLLPPLAPAAMRPTAWARRSRLKRGAIVGAAAVALVATPVVILFALVGPAQLPITRFIWFKASFAAGLGALVTPLIGWWALGDASRARQTG